MTLLPVSASPTGLALAAPGKGAPEPAIAAALADLPREAPLVIMIHGKGYSPFDPALDPHALIFAPRGGHGRSRSISWPRRLGFALPGPLAPRGLCVAFGWNSTGPVWRATAAADAVAPKLARLVQMIGRIAPGRRIDLIGHSLGARVIQGAVPLLAAGSVGRVLLLAGADFTERARRALASPAGSTAEFLNITTRENDLFDFLFERAHAPLGGAGALGRGLQASAEGAPNWLDIQLDNPATEAALRSLGLPLAAARARICHWSVYLRPGVFRFYRALLHDRQRLTLALLRQALSARPEPRWIRLVQALPTIGPRSARARAHPPEAARIS